MAARVDYETHGRAYARRRRADPRIAAAIDPTVRASQSIWQLVEPEVEERIAVRLAADLESGRWDEEHGALRGQQSYEGSLRLVISEPA